MRAIAVLAALSLLAATAGALAQAGGQRAPVARVGDQHSSFPADGRMLRLPLFANRRIDAADPGVRRAVVVLHGALRNADVYLDGMVAAAAGAGALDGTLVVAPQFLADVDAGAHTLDPSVARWTIESWKEGGGAVQPAGADPVASSSFAALDALLTAIGDRGHRPGLETIVVAGHSAGGQVVARYAPTGRADATLRAVGIRLRYIVANPSSWLYLDDRRPLPEGGFAPFPADRCAGFDDYKYGLRNPVPYVAAAPAAEIVARFRTREFAILLGDADNDPAHRLLDRSCAALAQGPHRFARGIAYAEYLRMRFGDAAPHHRLLVVPGVGHDNRSMFGSACGRAALFGDGKC